MHWLFRPSILVVLSVILTITAGIIVFWPFASTLADRAVARALPAGDQEIVWLNPATNAVAWERFVAAVQRLKTDRPDLGMTISTDANPFPSQTAEVPELAIGVTGRKGRLWFRWYKLTGDLGPGQWVDALARRNPPPLAIIGGGSSDRARDLAGELAQKQHQFPAPPLLLITLASLEEGLMAIYPERSFRFCFTNRQMAEAVADFIWNTEDLRPDTEPVYLIRWEDDPYSVDLADEFRRVLGPEGPSKSFQNLRTVQAAARRWAWLAGYVTLGNVPRGLELEGFLQLELRRPGPFWSMTIPYSVGSFNRPNLWEEGAAERLMGELEQHPAQQRPLLVLPAAPQPARRFLRALLRIAPLDARRFVVATGDALDFNTIYRDRKLTWPILDLPVPVVFFCHRNPVDPLAFQPDRSGNDNAPPDPAGKTSTGTQDLLVYRDIVETLVESAFSSSGLRDNADEVGRQLKAARLKDGRPRFTANGNQHSGSGEFVVCFRPVRLGDRTLPQARLQVWHRSDDAGAGRKWTPIPVAGKPELIVDYLTGTSD